MAAKQRKIAGLCPPAVITVRKIERDSTILHLHQLPPGQHAIIDHVEWDRLSPGEAQRLREFGVEEGATVENAHRAGFFGRGALACRVGRMTIAMRRSHADVIHVLTAPTSDKSSETKSAS